MAIADHLNKALNEMKFWKELGIDPIIARYGEIDIAYPADEKEYCDLGGCVVAMVVAISENKEELPIERVYFQVADVKPIHLIKIGYSVNSDGLLGDMVTKKTYSNGRICYENISFWALTACCFQADTGFIAVDFKGERKKFIITRGPWKLDNRIRECMNKHLAEQIKVAECVPRNILMDFINREFSKKTAEKANGANLPQSPINYPKGALLEMLEIIDEMNPDV
jgi:hypothetical protein